MLLPLAFTLLLIAKDSSPDVIIIPRQDVWVSPSSDFVLGEKLIYKETRASEPALLVKTPSNDVGQASNPINLRALILSILVMFLVALIGLMLF